MRDQMIRYRFFCPADGDLCNLRLEDQWEYDEDTYRAVCPSNHGWLVTISEEYEASDDGTAIFGFQCGMTNAREMRDPAIDIIL